MDNKLQIFSNNLFGFVRTTQINNKPYICLADVCKILDIGNVSQLKTRLNGDGVITNEVIDNLGRKQQATFIDESNLYKVIFQSRKPEAEQFTEWVTNEILPCIRQHGMYAVDDILENPDLAIATLQKLKEEREARKLAEAKNKELEADSKYLNEILQSKDTLLVTVIAQDYGMSPQVFNKLLHEIGIQHKVDGTWVLYNDYKKCGYTHGETYTYDKRNNTKGTAVNTKWTQKGRLFLYNKLKEKGIVPLIEKTEGGTRMWQEKE